MGITNLYNVAKDNIENKLSNIIGFNKDIEKNEFNINDIDNKSNINDIDNNEDNNINFDNDIEEDEFNINDINNNINIEKLKQFATADEVIQYALTVDNLLVENILEKLVKEAEEYELKMIKVNDYLHLANSTARKIIKEYSELPSYTAPPIIFNGIIIVDGQKRLLAANKRKDMFIFAYVPKR